MKRLFVGLAVVVAVVLLGILGCDTGGRSGNVPKPTERNVDIGDVSKIRAKPIRRTDGTVWDFHWLFTDYERLGRCVDTDEYLQAEKDGVAHRLDFGTGILLRNTEKRIPQWWAVEFEVEVLDGPHAGKTGWIDFDALHDYYRGQRPL